jgi:hypothetical protein
MSTYEPFIAAGIAGYLWEHASASKNIYARIFLRSASFVFAALSIGFLMLTHAELVQP